MSDVQQNQNRVRAGVPTGGQYSAQERKEGDTLTRPGPPAETLRRERGHDFYPKDFSDWPKTYGTEGIPTELKEVRAYYFSAGQTWYIVESDPDGYAFGYSERFDYPEGGEWGYISLPELEKVRNRYGIAAVERECYTSTKLVRDIIPKYKGKGGIVEKLPYSTKTPEVLNAEQLASRTEYRLDLLGLRDEPDGASDLLAASVVDGQLSRGVPGKQAADALRAWRVEAAYKAKTDPEYAGFMRGLQLGGMNLMRSKLGLPDDFSPQTETSDGYLEAFARSAETFAATKRASAADRKIWSEQLQLATSTAEWRGMLVAGATLSGTDSWWGFRDNVDRTIRGTGADE